MKEKKSTDDRRKSSIIAVMPGILLLLFFIFKQTDHMWLYFSENSVFMGNAVISNICGYLALSVCCVIISYFIFRIYKVTDSKLTNALYTLLSFLFFCPAAFPFLYKQSMSGEAYVYPLLLFLISALISQLKNGKYFLPVCIAAFLIPSDYALFVMLKRYAVLYVPAIILIEVCILFKDGGTRHNRKSRIRGKNSPSSHSVADRAIVYSSVALALALAAVNLFVCNKIEFVSDGFKSALLSIAVCLPAILVILYYFFKASSKGIKHITAALLIITVLVNIMHISFAVIPACVLFCFIMIFSQANNEPVQYSETLMLMNERLEKYTFAIFLPLIFMAAFVCVSPYMLRESIYSLLFY